MLSTTNLWINFGKPFKFLVMRKLIKFKNKDFLLLTTLFCISLLCGCGFTTSLYTSGGSRADGTITMTVTYGALRVPKINWEAARKKAIERCRLWGYSGGYFFETGNRECVDYNCNTYRNTYTFQCTK